MDVIIDILSFSTHLYGHLYLCFPGVRRSSNDRKGFFETKKKHDIRGRFSDIHETYPWPNTLGTSSRYEQTKMGRQVWSTEVTMKKEKVWFMELLIPWYVPGGSLSHGTRLSHIILDRVCETWFSELIISSSFVPLTPGRVVGFSEGRFATLSALYCDR